MAGYRVNFDGSLNERRDVPQVASASSLLQTIVTPSLSPNDWGKSNLSFLAKGGNPWISGWLIGLVGTTALANSFLRGTNSGGFPPNFSEGSVGNPAKISNFNGSSDYYFITPNFNGNVAWNINYGSGDDAVLEVYRSSSSTRTINNGLAGTVLYTTYPATVGSWFGGPTITNSSATFADQFLLIRVRKTPTGSNHSLQLYFAQIDGELTSVSGVTISPATNVNGVAPAGGISAIASPSTIVNGQSVLAGAPKLFGARVVHDTIDILEAKYLPPADASEDAQADPSAVKFITATSTSISVEGDGLGGTEKLGALETELIVEQTPGTTEN